MSAKKNFSLLLFFLPLICFAQKDTSMYKIDGHINLDTGYVTVKMIGPNMLDSCEFKNCTTKITNGRFSIEGRLNYPIVVSFEVVGKFNSLETILAPGNQSISLHADSNYSEPINSNNVMAERKTYNDYQSVATALTAKYRVHYDSLKKVYPIKFPDDVDYASRKELKYTYKIQDEALFKFMKDHPDSYYGLYRLSALVGFGFNERLGKAYQILSPKLKESPMGIELYKKITVAKRISVGAQLPDLNVLDQKGLKLNMEDFVSKKYILIDLWYSHCMPCIALFPDLKKIYYEYSAKGFEIIAISTDQEKYVNNWKSVVTKNVLPWPQYLDLNAKEAHRFNVRIYPTSLLIDQTGKILATEVSPVELRYFLKDKLK